MNRDDFLDSMNEIPFWVKSKEDALKYAKHLHYRLMQAKEDLKIFDNYTEKYLSRKINSIIEHELSESYSTFDDWYSSMSNEKKYDDTNNNFKHFTP